MSKKTLTLSKNNNFNIQSKFNTWTKRRVIISLMKHLLLVHIMLIQKTKPVPGNSTLVVHSSRHA